MEHPAPDLDSPLFFARHTEDDSLASSAQDWTDTTASESSVDPRHSTGTLHASSDCGTTLGSSSGSIAALDSSVVAMGYVEDAGSDILQEIGESTSTSSSAVMGYITDDQAPDPDLVSAQQSHASGATTKDTDVAPFLDPADEWTSSEGDDELPDDMGLLGDWSQRFRLITERISTFTHNTQGDVKMHAYVRLIYLAQDFLYAVKTFGKIITSEAFMPLEQKTIHPARNVGGVIGGRKYVLHNILFKFAVDDGGIFGLDADAASKVAGHELKGITALFNCRVKVLHVPMTALLDYRGFRLVAMAKLPISTSTLCIGSCDGGVMVHNEDAVASASLERAARMLNLKGHLTGLYPRHSAFLHTPVDLEVHKGTDKRYYLCDFSRLVPPERPQVGPRKVKQAYLYQLLRPEFVARYETPLCSDAFSQFIRAHDGFKEHNREVQTATEFLYTTVIPSVATRLLTLLLQSAPAASWLGTRDAGSARPPLVKPLVASQELDRRRRSRSRLATSLTNASLQRKHKKKIRKAKKAQKAKARRTSGNGEPPSNGRDDNTRRSGSGDDFPLTGDRESSLNAFAPFPYTASSSSSSSSGGGGEARSPTFTVSSGSSDESNESGTGNAGLLGFRLTEALHSNGVNMRHLFRIVHHVQFQSQFPSAIRRDCIRLLVAEMVARVIKVEIRAKLRQRMKIGSLSEEPFHRLLRSYLNRCFSSNARSIQYWNKCLFRRLVTKFCSHLTPSQCHRHALLCELREDLHAFVSHKFERVSITVDHADRVTPHMYILGRLQAMLRFRFAKKCQDVVKSNQAWKEKLAGGALIDEMDINDIGMRIKHMNIVAQAKGSLYMTKGLQLRASQPRRAVRFLQKAVRKLEEALSRNTLDKESLCMCAQALMYLEEESRRLAGKSSRAVAVGGHLPRSRRLALARSHFERATQLYATDADSLFAYASFLDRYGDHEHAERLYVRALASEPDHVFALKSYGDLLTDKGQHEDAEQLYMRARAVSNRLEMRQRSGSGSHVHGDSDATEHECGGTSSTEDQRDSSAAMQG